MLILKSPLVQISPFNRVFSVALISFLFIVGAIFLGCNKKKILEIEGMVFIPPGEFMIGSSEKDIDSLSVEFGPREKFFENEWPTRKIFQKGFYIDKYEVTNKDYKLFISKTNYIVPAKWNGGVYGEGRGLHPVSNVSWFDANSYCKWVGKRLPTEEEWEKAIRGPNGNIFPWGSEFSFSKANLNKGDTVPVGSIPEDRSFYGVHDMAGNLKEWTSSWYKPYPGSTLKSEYFGEKFKVIRGAAGNIIGHYNLPKIFSRSSYRAFFFLNGKVNDIGFRCAKSNEG